MQLTEYRERNKNNRHKPTFCARQERLKSIKLTFDFNPSHLTPEQNK